MMCCVREMKALMLAVLIGLALMMQAVMAEAGSARGDCCRWWLFLVCGV